jgi:hypothetical protein
MAGRKRRKLFGVPVVEGTVSEQDRIQALLRKSRERRFEVAVGSGINNKELQAQRARCRLQVGEDGLNTRIDRVREDAEPGSIG